MTTHYIAYEGVNLSLGAIQADYREDAVRAMNRRVDVSGTNQRAPYDPAGWDDWLSSLRNSRGEDEVLAVLRHTDTPAGREHDFIGVMGIHRVKWPDGVGTTGSMFYARDNQGKGHGKEAKLLLLHHCFDIMGLRKVVSSVKSFNGNSLGHLVACGYRIVGRHQKHLYHEGAYVDEILLEVFPEEWRPLYEVYRKTGVVPSLSSEQKALVRSEVAQ